MVRTLKTHFSDITEMDVAEMIQTQYGSIRRDESFSKKLVNAFEAADERRNGDDTNYQAIMGTACVAGTVKDLISAKAAHRQIFRNSRRFMNCGARPPVIQAWPTSEGRVEKRRSRSALKHRYSCPVAKKIRRQATPEVEESVINGTEIYETIMAQTKADPIITFAVGDKTTSTMKTDEGLQKGEKDSFNDSQAIDLTQDEDPSVWDSTAVTEIASNLSKDESFQEDIPSETSFSRYLEERPGTGKWPIGPKNFYDSFNPCYRLGIDF